MTPNEQAIHENYQILKAERDELLEALEPFARWAKASTLVEQPDYLQFQTLDNEGRCMLDEITASDLRLALDTFTRAKE